jgi:hypothetical protein
MCEQNAPQGKNEALGAEYPRLHAGSGHAFLVPPVPLRRWH